MHNVLFLCTGNSARSIMAEVMLNHLGRGRFTAHSAGSRPTGKVHPLSLETLEATGFPAPGIRSKSWDEYAAPGAPAIDVVITVCDGAAGEACPIWPGHPVRAHWGVADPAAVPGTIDEQRAAFRAAAETLRTRIERLVSLPTDSLDRAGLERSLREIGEA